MAIAIKKTACILFQLKERLGVKKEDLKRPEKKETPKKIRSACSMNINPNKVNCRGIGQLS